MCEIHSNLGEEFLCDTCKIYPRGINIIGEKCEKHIYTSCPAMIEQFLLTDEKLSFEIVMEDFNQKEIIKNIDFRSNLEEKLLSDIRIFTIQILQSDILNIEEKIILVGLIYKKCDKDLKEKNLVLLKTH